MRSRAAIGSNAATAVSKCLARPLQRKCRPATASLSKLPAAAGSGGGASDRLLAAARHCFGGRRLRASVQSAARRRGRGDRDRPSRRDALHEGAGGARPRLQREPQCLDDLHRAARDRPPRALRPAAAGAGADPGHEARDGRTVAASLPWLQADFCGARPDVGRGHPQTVRPLVAPMAVAAAEKEHGELDDDDVGAGQGHVGCDRQCRPVLWRRHLPRDLLDPVDPGRRSPLTASS